MDFATQHLNSGSQHNTDIENSPKRSDVFGQLDRSHALHICTFVACLGGVVLSVILASMLAHKSRIRSQQRKRPINTITIETKTSSEPHDIEEGYAEHAMSCSLSDEWYGRTEVHKETADASVDLIDIRSACMPSLAKRRVHFDLSATTYHEVTPYAEVYGMHLNDFNFDKRVCPPAWCFVGDAASDSDEDQTGDCEEGFRLESQECEPAEGGPTIWEELAFDCMDQDSDQDDEQSTLSPNSESNSDVGADSGTSDDDDFASGKYFCDEDFLVDSSCNMTCQDPSVGPTPQLVG